jgi:hypothetical protein
MKSYLYPKMKTLTAFKSALLVVACLSVAAASFAQQNAVQTTTPELVFSNPSLVGGSDKQDGAIYKFANVTPGIDAMVTINGRSSSKVTLSNIDLTGTGYDNAFQPQVAYNGGHAKANQNWWMEFQISFVQAGTTTPTMVSGFNVTGLDIDGDGNSLHEYLSFTKLKSYTLESPTAISVLDFLLNLLSVGKEFDGCYKQYAGVDPKATDAMVTNQYVNTSSFTVRTGGKTGNASSDQADRMNSLWFKSFTFSNPVQTTLPLELVSFTAQLENKTVLLDWVTAQEKNTSHFVIQRSQDGQSFNDDGMLFTDNDNSAKQNNYTYNDNVSSVSTNMVYYRLKMVDKDGQSTYSDTKVIRLEQTALQQPLIVYPNPAVNELRVTVPNSWQNQTIAYSFYNINGNLVKQTISNHAGQTEVTNIADLPAGMYIVKVINGNQTAVQRFVKAI